MTISFPSAVGAAVGASSSASTETSGALALIGREGVISLTGTYDPTTSLVSLWGGGFALDGLVLPGGAQLEGTFADPAGAPGVFSTRNSSLGSVTTYCGTYSGSLSGTFNMVVSGGAVSGAYSETSGGAGTFHGTIQIQGGTLSGRADDSSGTTTSFNGTLQGGTLRATWRDSDGESGTLSCSTPCR